MTSELRNSVTITVEWTSEEQKQLLWVIQRGWSKNDYLAAVERSYDLMEAVDRTVDVVVDARNANVGENNLLTLARIGMQHRSSNLGQVTLVHSAQNPVFSILNSALERVYKWEVRFQLTTDETVLPQFKTTSHTD